MSNRPSMYQTLQQDSMNLLGWHDKTECMTFWFKLLVFISYQYTRPYNSLYVMECQTKYVTPISDKLQEMLCDTLKNECASHILFSWRLLPTYLPAKPKNLRIMFSITDKTYCSFYLRQPLFRLYHVTSRQTGFFLTRWQKSKKTIMNTAAI